MNGRTNINIKKGDLYGRTSAFYPKKVDIAFKNTAVYTVDKDRSWTQTVAIKDGEIIYVGDTDGLDLFIGPEIQIMDLKGKMLLPGFHDTFSRNYQAKVVLTLFDGDPVYSSGQFKKC